MSCRECNFTKGEGFKFRACFAAISEEDFYGRPPRSRAGTGEAAMRLGAGPPSPQSLQPTALYGDDADDGSNPHKKLTHTSSLSAPEVNRVRVFRVQVFLLIRTHFLNCLQFKSDVVPPETLILSKNLRDACCPFSDSIRHPNSTDCLVQMKMPVNQPNELPI